MDFDFGLIATQGLTITTLCWNSLNQLLQQPFVPDCSHYHLVIHAPGLRSSLAQINPWPIVQSFVKLNSLAICDVCLPYREQNGRVYLGRYVIWRGELLGVRLCTEISYHFKAWEPGKLQKVQIDGINSQKNMLVGQFNLRTANSRIALLFSSELTHKANQYANNAYDLILLCIEHPLDQLQLNILHRIQQRTMTISNNIVNRWQLLKKDQLQQLSEGTMPEQMKNVIVEQYISLEEVFASKAYYKLTEIHTTAIDELYIPVYFNQPPKQIPYRDNYKHQLYQLDICRTGVLPHSIASYLGRVLDLLTFAELHKIVIFLEQNPHSLCMLYVLSQLTSLVSIDKDAMNKIFKVVVMENDDKMMELLLERTDFFDLDNVIFVNKDEKSAELSILAVFDTIAINEAEQHYFPIVADPSNIPLSAIIHLLNNRLNTPNNTDQSQTHLQSWLLCSFFHPTQMSALYHSSSFRTFINCQDLIADTKILIGSQFGKEQNIFVEMTKQMIAKNQKDSALGSGRQQGESGRNMKGDNPIIPYFHNWLHNLPIQFQSVDLSHLFFHFLIRQITKINALVSPFNHNPSFASELLSINKEHIDILYSFFVPVGQQLQKIQEQFKTKMTQFWKKIIQDKQPSRESEQTETDNVTEFSTVQNDIRPGQPLSDILTISQLINQKQMNKLTTLSYHELEEQTNLKKPVI